MSESSSPIRITHYSDILCVWAYLSQIRIDELNENFPAEVEIEYRFLQVFGDVPGKMATQWADRGGLQGYAQHVQDVAAGFEHIDVHTDAWRKNTPHSSVPAHIMLCGLRLQQNDAALMKAINGLRQAFFVELADVSQQNVLLDIAASAGADTTALEQAMQDGSAHAQFSADLQAAANGGVKSSPTLVFNEGRQMLAGNVGYRVIEANIRELLREPGDQQSWC